MLLKQGIFCQLNEPESVWKPQAHPPDPPVFSSFSIMAFRACAADVLGNVWALISSDLSVCLCSRADVLLELRDVLSSRSKTLKETERKRI